jgi:predicted amidophosphoribosyltransferase
LRVLAQLLDLVIPRRCAGCDRPGQLLCASCAPPGAPLPVVLPGLATAAATAYDGAVREALLQYKERGRRDLAGPLGDLLAAAVDGLAHGLADGLADVGRGSVLVPVPSGRAAAAARGGDHVLRLARRAGAVSGHRVVRALRLGRAVADSAGLDTAQRAANLAGAMRAVRPPRDGVPAVVVDDITTTGATLLEAHRALAAAGWDVRGAAVVAATQRRHPIGSTQRCGLASG